MTVKGNKKQAEWKDRLRDRDGDKAYQREKPEHCQYYIDHLRKILHHSMYLG